jgi:uncharacterized protein (DUF2345 family)
MTSAGHPQGSAATAPASEEEAATSLLDLIEPPVQATQVTLASGRRYELEAGTDADRLVVRSQRGDIVLRVEVTDAGPVLWFSGASVNLQATRRLRLAAEEVSVEASGNVSLSAGGSLRETVAGDHHARISGDQRVEARNVELQASAGAVGIRAMKKIALDGEHIGLNDDPEPKPFEWSEIACDRTEG